MRSMIVSLDQEREWADAVAAVPHAYGHTWHYNQAMTVSSGHATHLFVHVESTGMAVLPFAERRHGAAQDIYSPYGWSGVAATGRVDGLADAWRSVVRRRGYVCGYLVMHPALALPDGFARDDEEARSNHVYMVDLTRSLDELMAGVAADHRHRLRQWTRLGVELVEDQEALRDAFLDLYPRFVRRIGAAPVYDFSAAGLARLLASPDVLLLGALNQGRVAAVSLFLHSREVGEYFLTALDDGGEIHTRALIWRAIERLKARGVPALNLGGGVRKGDSLEAFKRRFGGQAMDIVALKQIYDGGRFTTLCAEAGAQPDRSGYFPPYHAPTAARDMTTYCLDTGRH